MALVLPRKAGFNGFYSYVSPLLDQAFVSGGNFLIIAICARLLPAADQGKLGYVISAYLAVIIFNMTSIFQWASVQAPNLTDKNAYRMRLAGTQVLLAGFSAFISTFVVGALSIPSGWSMSTGEGAVMLLFLLVQQLADFDRRMSYIFRTPGRALVSSATLFTVRILLLVLFRPGSVFQVMLILTVSGLPPALFTVAAGLKGGIGLNGAWNFFKGQSVNARWLMASGPLAWSWGAIPVFLLGSSISMEVVGVFVTIRSLANIANVLMEILETEFSAKAGRLYVSDRSGFESLFRKTRFRGLLFWAAGSVLLYFFGQFSLELLFGEAYSGYGDLLLALWACNGIIFLVRLNAVMLRTTERSAAVTLGYAAAVIATLVAFYPLLMFFGVLGGALLLGAGAVGNYVGQGFFETRISGRALAR